MLKSHKHAGHSLGPYLIHKEMFEYIYRLRSIYSIQYIYMYIIVFLRTCSVSQKVWHVSLSHLMSSLKPASARLIPATTIYVTFSNSGSIGVETDCPQMQPNLPDSAQPGKSCKCQPVVVLGRLKMTVQLKLHLWHKFITPWDLLLMSGLWCPCALVVCSMRSMLLGHTSMLSFDLRTPAQTWHAAGVKAAWTSKRKDLSDSLLCLWQPVAGSCSLQASRGYLSVSK